MLRNHFKIAIRYLARHKGYTMINTLGLALVLPVVFDYVVCKKRMEF